MQCQSGPCQERICAYGCLRELEQVVRNIIYHIMHSPNEIDDIVQDVLLKIYQSIDEFRGGSFRAYAARIARNQCYDTLRKKRTERRREAVEHFDFAALPTQTAGPEELAVTRAMAAEISGILGKLKPVDQEIVLLRHVHQFSYDEISAVVGLRAGAVRTRLSRTRQRIMEELERREQHEPSQLG